MVRLFFTLIKSLVVVSLIILVLVFCIYGSNGINWSAINQSNPPNHSLANKANCLLADGINVQAVEHILYICENGNTVKEFRVSLGKSGTGKKAEGDKKTPLGLYELGIPRKSHGFGMFIPIKYPTKEQSKMGYTGKDVGIHGPFVAFSWLGSLNTLFNWTLGCIAVGQTDQIKFIAAWIKSHPNSKLLIN